MPKIVIVSEIISDRYTHVFSEILLTGNRQNVSLAIDERAFDIKKNTYKKYLKIIN